MGNKQQARDNRDYLCAAVAAAVRAPEGRPFVLRDLFKGVEWEQIPRGGRLSLGRDFKREVQSGHVPTVSYVGKAENNSAQYVRASS